MIAAPVDEFISVFFFIRHIPEPTYNNCCIHDGCQRTGVVLRRKRVTLSMNLPKKIIIIICPYRS